MNIEVPKCDVEYLEVGEYLSIPKRPGLYYFYNAQHEIMYVGKASGLKQRISQHIKGCEGTADLKHNFTYVSFVYVDCPVEREIYETFQINKLKPPLNWDKVFTYQSEKFSPKYNPLWNKRRERLLDRFNKSMEGFKL